MYKITIKVEEIDNTPTREEILEIIKTEFQIAAYQAETYLMWKRGIIDHKTMVNICTDVLLDQSNKTRQMFSEWLEDQIENLLPIRSSGSTFTSLTDYDNILVTYDGEIPPHIWVDIQDDTYKLYDSIIHPVKIKGYNEFKK